jgi:hypothetical protein
LFEVEFDAECGIFWDVISDVGGFEKHPKYKD